MTFLDLTGPIIQAFAEHYMSPSEGRGRRINRILFTIDTQLDIEVLSS